MKPSIPRLIASLLVLGWLAMASQIYSAAPSGPPSTSAGISAAQPPKELTLDLGNNVGLKMVLIPAGKFMMGNPADEPDLMPNEEPQKEVVIAKPFYMSIYEVTQQQYEQVTGKNPSKFKGPQNPVDFVNWDLAVDFCKKVSAKTDMTARLATEAEWEYACRAGSKTRFYYGDDLDYKQLGDYAWYGYNSGRTTHPVGKKKPNAWGLYDMYGNVWEWCAEPDKPAGGPAALFRPIRGGGWMNEPRLCRSARRAGDPHTTAADHLGIRLVVDVPASPPRSK